MKPLRHAEFKLAETTGIASQGAFAAVIGPLIEVNDADRIGKGGTEAEGEILCEESGDLQQPENRE